jgi:hypothetical protein
MKEPTNLHHAKEMLLKFIFRKLFIFHNFTHDRDKQNPQHSTDLKYNEGLGRIDLNTLCSKRFSPLTFSSCRVTLD